MAMGWLRPPYIGRYGVTEATPWPLGVVWPPSTANEFFFFLFLVWALGVAGSPPMAMGWLQPPQISRSGAAEAIPQPMVVVQPPLMGWPATLDFFKIFFNLFIILVFN
jgi:hypothetical protein